MVSWGVNDIWNFAPVELRLPKHVVMENVHLTESLMRLSYNIRAAKNKKSADMTQKVVKEAKAESAATKE